MNFTLFTAVFLCLGWTVEVAGNERPPDCCPLVTDTKTHSKNIVKYSIQEPPLCSIRAVRFYTKKNKVICSDPNSDWAKIVILNWDRTTKGPEGTIKCRTSKKIQITTRKTPGTHTETSTSTTVQPTVKVINTSGPENSTSTTITTSRPETSKSTTVQATVTVINTSGPESSTSTTITTSRPETSRSTTVETIKTSQLETENSIRSTKKSETPPQTSLDIMTTCGTDEPMTPPKETSNPVKVTSKTPVKRTKPSRLKLKARKKNKKELRKLQMGKMSRNKSE